MAFEAAALGIGGSGVGALLALVGGVALALPLGTLAAVSALAGLGGLAVAVVASVLPVSRVAQLSMPRVLAEE